MEEKRALHGGNVKAELIWMVGVKKANRGKKYSATGKEWFATRKDCQEFIDADEVMQEWIIRKQFTYKPILFRAA